MYVGTLRNRCMYVCIIDLLRKLNCNPKVQTLHSTADPGIEILLKSRIIWSSVRLRGVRMYPPLHWTVVLPDNGQQSRTGQHRTLQSRIARVGLGRLTAIVLTRLGSIGRGRFAFCLMSAWSSNDAPLSLVWFVTQDIKVYQYADGMSNSYIWVISYVFMCISVEMIQSAKSIY